MKIMDSINFEMLRTSWPELATLGGFAEQYAHSDASSAMIKLRTYCEHLVAGIYQVHNITFPYSYSLFDLLADETFKTVVPNVVLDKMHLIRLHGNKAAHGQTTQSETALTCLLEAWDLGRWYFISYGGGHLDECPAYQEPPVEDTKAKIKKDKKAALEKLATQEAQLQELLQQVDTLRLQAKAAEKTEAELLAFKAAGQAAVDTLKFDEVTTRKRLIDKELVEVGWDVDPKGANTAQVSQEVEIPHQPTSSTIGYADYVLWDDAGKPLAVIEAKKTAVDAEQGRTQAKLYADGLEQQYVQRPVIFFTNGYDIFIWDDAQDYPPRRIFGFYSKDSLEYLVRQRQIKQPLETVKPKKEIIGNRLYQIEAIQRVCERFTKKQRKALIVQATGSGKTRVAIALTDVLIRAHWGLRVLFLCDRLELRKQAKNAFGNPQFMSEPLTLVTAKTAKDRNKRIYLATYPAMMKIFQTFDPGFFDLIIADESHRSIYNRYADLFRWFDCLQVGLTATPVEKIHRNTYKLFDCQNQNPTAYYSLDQAVKEGYLIPYEVFTHTTQFLRSGIKFDQLSQEQKEELEDAGENPALFNYEADELDKKIFNRDTNREIIRNLMENGIRDAAGQVPGKTIIFARNHNHALLLASVFDELYPQYGGKFCQVIDNYDTRAEQLIDDFKDPTNPLTIAISVDMLDTGIDVPEVVNLVFAKPVFSWVKFHQMIGRGTRLCEDLFGPGKDKTKFRIFDHWGNFERFDVPHPEADTAPSKSLMQQVFEARLILAETALSNAEIEILQQTVKLIRGDIKTLDEKTIAVREKWKEISSVLATNVLDQFAPTTVASLRTEIAPLMQWLPILDHADAHTFDLLLTNAQIECLRQSGRLANFKDMIQERVNQLLMHLNPVQSKAAFIKKVKSSAYWDQVTVADLEEMRTELRGIMHHRQKDCQPKAQPKIIDVADGDVVLTQRASNIKAIDMQLYRQLVEETLEKLFDTNPVLQKIRRCESVTLRDLDTLKALVLTQNPDVNLELLKEFYPDSAPPLDYIIRTIVGMDPEAVEARFAAFARKFSESAKQTQFLRLLKNHIRKYGTITIDRLYEEPFTTIDSNGLDGVFHDDGQIDELMNILRTFEPIESERGAQA